VFFYIVVLTMLDIQDKNLKNDNRIKQDNNVNINLKNTLNISEEQWEQEKRYKIDKLLNNELLNILINIDFPSDLKERLEKFCSIEQKDLSYDFLKSIGFSRIIKNRLNIEKAINNHEKIIPQIEIINDNWLAVSKDLISSLLKKSLSEEKKNIFLHMMIQNKLPFSIVDFTIAEMSSHDELPNSIKDEYNVLNISNLNINQYQKAKWMGFWKYRENHLIQVEKQERAIDKENFKDIIMVVTTMYKNTPQYRKELALDFFEKLMKLGIKCVVWDWWSDKDFLEKLNNKHEFPFVTIENLNWKSDKLNSWPFWNDKRAALAKALDLFPSKDYPWAMFVQTEPEKKRFADPLNMISLVNAMQDKSIVIANRKSKISMPALQASEEERAGKKLSTMIWSWKYIDFFQSASICTRELAQYFIEYEPLEKESYDGVMVPYIYAYKSWLSVWIAEVNATYSWKEKIYEQRWSGRNIFTKKRVFNQYLDLVPKIERQVKYMDHVLSLKKN